MPLCLLCMMIITTVLSMAFTVVTEESGCSLVKLSRELVSMYLLDKNRLFYRALEEYRKAIVEIEACPSKDKQKQVLDDVYSAAAPQSLIDHSKEFDEKRMIKVMEGVYFFIGYAMGNSIVIKAPDGLIVVDTLEGYDTAKEVVEQLRSAGITAPVKALVYTHNHPDHIGGSKAFIEHNPPGTKVEVWAYKTLEDEFWGKFKYNRGLILRRSLRMFGVNLRRPALINAGLGYELITDENAGLIKVRPNKALESEEMKVNIAGLDVTLIHIPGETRDQMAVYVPSMKIMCSGDDVYKTFPNLYSIRGTPPRPVENWMHSIDKMLEYDIEYLLPSHTLPVEGKVTVQNVLTNYRDAIQYVFDQTIRLMNRGLHPDDIAQTIQLPVSLRNESHLLEHYGTVEWSSKTIFEGQLGWFSGFPEELYPLKPKSLAGKVVGLVDEKILLTAANKALGSSDGEDIKWALWLSTQVWYGTKDQTDKTYSELARELRSKALVKLASLQTSPNGRNYLLTWALEENCGLPKEAQRLQEEHMFAESNTINAIPIDLVVRKMGTLLDPTKVADVPRQKVKLHFTDIGKTFDLTLRNSVLDTKWVGEDDCHDNVIYDITISITEQEFRDVLNRKKKFRETDANIKPSAKEANTFIRYFDDPNYYGS